MCKRGNFKFLRVIGNDGKPKNVGIDSCIYDLVKALNDANIQTVACCCGHGEKHGIISLRDGRELIITQNLSEALNCSNTKQSK